MLSCMNMAIGYALAGLDAATSRVTIRAENIANLQSVDYRAATPVQIATAAGPVVRAERPTVFQGRAPAAYVPAGLTPAGTVALEEQIVDLRVAATAYGASAAVLRTAFEMDRMLIEALA